MPCVDSINKAVCFDHFPPFSSSFGTILVQNCCDYLWEKQILTLSEMSGCVLSAVARLPPSPLACTLSCCGPVLLLNSPVILPPLPVQSSCMPLILIADTGLVGWLNRKYTHLAAGHRSTTSHKVATMYSSCNIHSFSRLPELQRGNQS